MERFNGERVAAMMNMLRLPEDTPIENKMVARSIQSAQTQVESQNFEIRKDVLKYDEVLNKQRTLIYDERRQVLSGADLSDQIRSMITGVVTSYVEGATASGYPEEWDLEQLWTALRTLYPISLTIEEAVKTAGGELNDLTREFLVEEIVADAQAAYDQREEELGAENTRELERRVLLSVLDRKWREHLYEMDYLQEGIGLRAMAQRDPLVEYQHEGFDMFTAMMDAIQEESVGFLFNLEVEIEQASAGRLGPRWAGRRTSWMPRRCSPRWPLAVTRTRPPGSRPVRSRTSRPRAWIDSEQAAAPLTYSAPALGSDTPEVHTEGGQRPATSRAAKTASQRRANPNRGSRGNKRKR